ncbi:MAG: hypothetical protein WCL07_01345 [bacterium]
MPYKVVGFILLFLFSCTRVLAGPSSSNYELKSYEFGSGGVNETDSTNYGLRAISGSQTADRGFSSNFMLNSGLLFVNQANTPAVPTLTNPASYYDRLKFAIAPESNVSNAQFAIAISTDNFVTASFIQLDHTIGGSESWQTYADWGGVSGSFVRTLHPNTTYQIMVKAKNGAFSESAYSLGAAAATSVPSLSFGISNSTLTFNNLNGENAFTDSSKSTALTTSTNAYYGYTVYAHTDSPLTSGGNTIADYTSPNSSPTSWSGTGFGYTTDDSELLGGVASRFVTPAAKYAGFVSSSIGDPVADHTTNLVDASILSEQFNIGYRVTAPDNTPAGAYKTKIIYIVVPTY